MNNVINIQIDNGTVSSVSYRGVWSVPSYGSYSYNDISGSALKNYIQHLAAAFHLLDYCSAGSYCPTAYLTRERTAHMIAVVFIPGMAYQAEPAKGLAVSFPPLPDSVSGAGKALAAPIRALQVPQIAATHFLEIQTYFTSKPVGKRWIAHSGGQVVIPDVRQTLHCLHAYDTRLNF